MSGELKFGNKVVMVGGRPLTLPSAASDPGSAVAGDLYYNTVSNTIKVYNGTSWVALSTGSSSSSGVFGSVQFSDGAGGFSSDAANIFWDNSSKHLGIGTGVPRWALEVINATPGLTALFLTGQTSGDGGLAVEADSLLVGLQGTNGSLSGAIDLSLQSGGGNLLVPNPSTLFGLGNPTPTVLLDVLSSANTVAIIKSTASSGQVNNIILDSNANTGMLIRNNVSTSGLYIGNSGGNTKDYQIANIESVGGTLSIVNLSVPQIVLDASGNLKLGATGLIWPAVDGSSGQVLSTNGAGLLSWTSASGGTPSDFIFTNSSAQSWNGPGPALLVDSVLTSGGYAYLGSADVPLGNTTDDSTWVAVQTGFILEPTSMKNSRDLELLSGFNYGSQGETGGVRLFSGDFSNAAATIGNTGIVRVYSGNTNGVLGDSGRVDIFSGNSVNGASGDVIVSIGTAGTTPGKIKLDGKTATTGARVDHLRVITGTDTLSAFTDYKAVCSQAGGGSFLLNLPAGEQGLNFILSQSAVNTATFTITANGGDSLDANIQTIFNTNQPVSITFDAGTTTWYAV